MKKIILILLVTAFTTNLYSQDDTRIDNGATFVQVDYIKTIPGKNYGEILNNKWKKLAEKRIKDGTILGWDAWWNMSSTDESNHDIMIVTLLKDIDSINANQGILKAFPEMSEEEVAEFQKKNREARKIVNSTIFTIVDNYFKQDSVPNIAVLNYMKVKSGDEFEYEKMEKEYKENVDNSPKAGWAVHKRVDRVGTNLGYNYMTVDFYNKMSEVMLERAPTWEMSEEFREEFNKVQNLRKHVYSETHWNFITLR
tara:strand:+ start:60 stop:821 length:762 start_codon:yes stop_codon:yes gene_type:complete